MDTNTKKRDILNRGEFIQRTVDIVKLISAHKGNMTFAIDGAWGCGKTFVLEEIEERLFNDPSKNYLVIPYNCWQYDYYDEPLVALVAALNDFADSTKVIPEDTKTEIKKIASKVGVNLVTQVVKNKLGFDLGETIAVAKEAIDSASDAVEEQHAYDTYFGFKRVLTAIKLDLQELAERYTLVFAVDELDRCLPEYAIKVLERLHHVTDDLPNTICIISIDKKRLSNTINSIFGNNSADDYLKKFIRFTIELDTGKQNGQAFFDKFSAFRNRFDASIYGELSGCEQFLEELFDGISPREQEMIVEKATIFNDICFGSEKQDYTMMYMLLFLATLHYHYGDEQFSYRGRPVDFENPFGSSTKMPQAFKKRESGFSFKNPRCYGPEGRFVINSANIFMVVYFYWYHISVFQRELSNGYLFPTREEKDQRLEDNLNKLRNSIGTLSVIE